MICTQLLFISQGVMTALELAKQGRYPETLKLLKKYLKN